MTLPSLDPTGLIPPVLDWRGIPRHFMHPGEMEVLVGLVRGAHAVRMAEFGCNEGRTAKALLRHVSSLTCYVGVDVPRGHVPSLPVQRREVPRRPGRLVRHDRRFRLLTPPRGTADLGADELMAAAGGPLDVVFIDGDHGAAAVRHDSALARAALRPGGLIVWHDVHDDPVVQVKAVLEDLRAEGHDIVHYGGTWFAFQVLPLDSAGWTPRATADAAAS